MLNFLQRYANFAFLMAFVIGWSSVAFAVQKPIHQQMMNRASAIQMPMLMDMGVQPHSSENQQPEQNNTAHHAVKQIQMPDCHESGVQLHTEQTAADCPSGGQQMGSTAQCSDCALWHCQTASSYLHMHSVHFQPPVLSEFSEQPNVIYNGKHLQGHRLELLRPPKA